MFKHFIKFITTPELGTIEISEPIGFDQSSYKVKQNDKGFSRDIIIANEDSELTFSRSFFEELGTMQTLPNGDVINHASLGFDYLIDIFETEGWEGKIEYLLLEDNILFSTGIFSYVTAVVEFDNIKVKIIQNTNREIIKRLEDTDIDAFNDTALDGRTITPCQTTDILLKAKPTVQKSKFKSQETNVSAGAVNTKSILGTTRVLTSANNSNTVVEFGIENTLSFLSPTINTNTAGVLNDENFTYIYAQNTLTDVQIDLTNIVAYAKSSKSNSGIDTASGFARLVVKTGIDVDNITNEYVLFNQNFGNSDSANINLPTSLSLNIPLLERGNRIYIYAYCEAVCTFNPATPPTYFYFYNTTLPIDSIDISISAISTAIDTITKGVRLIDLAKHNLNSLANVPLIAPYYDVNGEHYDNFAFNGLLLGQITDKPFYNKFKELMNFSEETCSDIQINPTNVELLPYEEYYPDVEIAVFDNIPSLDASSSYNKRYSLKTSEFKYKRSSDNRETNGQNSIDDVHTETQKFLTDSVDSNLKVEINHIRSAFLIEEARRRAFDNDQSKSLENDDNLFLLKCVPLAPSSQGGFSAVLQMRVLTSNRLEILNNNADGDGINFNWNLLGFSVTSNFYIDAGENIGAYVVLSITPSVLTLIRVSGNLNFNGQALITMRWFYTNVLYTNQTDEGYTLIEGVANPTNYSNLDYHWARNIKRWYKYLATATKFKLNGVIKTASFKTNGLLKTQKIGESAPIEDSADIVNAIIATEKILTPMVHTVKVYSDFTKTTQLINDVQNIKGYVTVKLDNERTIKGYVKEMEYLWITEELDLVLEEKFEGDFMEITSIGITYPQYPNKNNLASFQVNNIFVLLFDSEDVQLYPPVRFTKIKINGVAYTDLTAFTDALTNLIN
jgi:hypothetical protein